MAKAPQRGMSENEMDDTTEDDMTEEDESESEGPMKKARGGMVKAAKKAPAKAAKTVKNYSRIARPQKFSGIF